MKALTPVRVVVGDIPIDIALPRPPPKVTEEWTRWGDEESESSSESSSYLDDDDDDRARDSSISDEDDINEPIIRPRIYKGDKALELKPWKTLLPLEFIHNLREPPSDLDEEMLQRYQLLCENPTTEVSEAVSRFVQSLHPGIP